jgi:hypothetical protein
VGCSGMGCSRSFSLRSTSLSQAVLPPVDVPALERQASQTVISTEVNQANDRLTIIKVAIKWPIMVMVRQNVSRPKTLSSLPASPPPPRESQNHLQQAKLGSFLQRGSGPTLALAACRVAALHCPLLALLVGKTRASFTAKELPEGIATRHTSRSAVVPAH